GALRTDHAEHDADAPAVDRVEVDPLRTDEERRRLRLRLLEGRMRDRHAIPDSGALKPLAFDQVLLESSSVHMERTREHVGEDAQGVGFVSDVTAVTVDEDPIDGEDFAESHE